MLITATKPFRYGRRDMRAGDTLDVPSHYARPLVYAGNARYATRALGEPIEQPVEMELEKEASKRRRRKRKADAEFLPDPDTALE